MAQRPFEEIVAEHGEVVMRVCRSLLGAVDAEDAWSETFLAALKRYPELPPDSNVKGWLVTIAHNKSIDAIRSRTRRAVPAGDVPERPGASASGIPGDLTAGGDLRLAVEALTPRQRAAVVYRYVADLSYGEIAELLESTPAAARRSAADGIANLRATYRKDTT
jgi:RNA polymerase sigma factor (sigma-70 family)